MNGLPREHGLIVSWILTVVGALSLTTQFDWYGILLTILLLPTLFVYDRLIIGLRLWSLGKLSLSRLLAEKIGTAWVALLSVAVAYIVLGVLLGTMPLLPVLTIAVVLALEVSCFRLLRERHTVTRAVSILTITSQFLLINSALSGRIDEFEIIAFAMISAVNVLLVVDVVELVEVTKINHAASRMNEIRADAPFFVGALVVAALISALSSLYYLSFVVILVAIQASFLSFARGRSIKVIGIISTVVEVVALALLLARFYGVA